MTNAIVPIQLDVKSTTAIENNESAHVLEDPLGSFSRSSSYRAAASGVREFHRTQAERRGSELTVGYNKRSRLSHYMQRAIMRSHEMQEMAVLAAVAIFFAAGLAVMSYVGMSEPATRTLAEPDPQSQSPS